jgi:hypothetical protein
VWDSFGVSSGNEFVALLVHYVHPVFLKGLLWDQRYLKLGYHELKQFAMAGICGLLLWGL